MLSSWSQYRATVTFFILVVGGQAGLCGCASLRLPHSSGANPPWFGSIRADPSVCVDELSVRESVQACLVTAREMESHGHPREALALYERARQLDPDSSPGAATWAALYDQSGDRSKALAEYGRALEEVGDDPDLLNDAADLHYRLGNLAEAESLLRRALTVKPTDARVANNLGRTLSAQGRTDEAFATLAGVLGTAAAHSNLGVFLARQGRMEQARVHLQRAQQMDSSLPALRHLLSAPPMTAP
ncbi:MAG: tetratricopeptide repeat protein [Pirellulaceae bacterium]